MDFACATVSGKEFQGLVTLRGKSVFLIVIFDLWINNFSVSPLFPVLKDAPSHFKSLGEDSLSYKLCISLKTSIISPRKRQYANYEGSFSEFSLST